MAKAKKVKQLHTKKFRSGVGVSLVGIRMLMERFLLRRNIG